MNVVVTRKNRRSKWYLLIVAGNGEIVFASQRYFSKSNAVRAGKNIVDAANISSVSPWRLEVPK